MNKCLVNTVFYPLVIVLLISNAIIYLDMVASSLEKPSQHSRQLPSSFDGWHSQAISIDQVIIDVLSPDQMAYQTFFKKGNVPITIFLSFYNSLNKSDLSHSPIVCFSGQGWEIVSVGETSINGIDGNDKDITVNRLEQIKDGHALLTYYWYQNYDRSFKHRGIQKLFLLYNRLRGRSENNGFIRFTVEVPASTTTEDIEKQLTEFLRTFYPFLIKYMA